MRTTGAIWEELALHYLNRAGLKLLERNFTSRFGELDLVMRDGDCIVFVEVRYRNCNEYGDGAASVGSAKQAKLARTAQCYLQAHPELANRPCRFDVIGCHGTPEEPALDWRRAAFEALS